MNRSNIDKIATHPLQTEAWGEFRKEWGNQVLYTKYGLLTLHKIPKTSYKIGMFIKGQMPTSEMLLDLQELGKEKKIIFIKLEPDYVTKKGGISCADEKKVISALKKANAAPGKTLFTRTTFWINLAKPEEELLKSFSSKTRYNIRLATRKGVSVSVDNSDRAFEDYIRLMRRTVEHQKFYAHSEKYHTLMWQSLKKEGISHLLLAKHENKTIAAWILFIWKDTIYYPYGTSDERYRNLMASNLMMWEAIRFGKKHNLKTFDLWGREPGKGFTKFKEGYNPEVIEFLGTWDLVVNKKLYLAYRAADALRWLYLRTKSQFSKPSF